MNKTKEKSLLVLFVVGIVTLGSLMAAATLIDGNKSTSATQMLSESYATSLATNAVPGIAKEVELEKLDGRTLYSVEIESEKGEYDVRIDPYTGEVVKIELETEVGRKEVELIQAKISEDDAKNIALSQVGGQVKEVEVEKVNGKYVYEIEIKNDEGMFDVAVDLVNGRILGVEQELQEEEDDHPSFTTSGSVSQDKAVQIAQQRLGSGWSLEEVDTGSHQGKSVWEVEFEDGNEEAEVLVDMNSGTILDVEYGDD